MRISIDHRSTYEYETPATFAVLRLYLTPLDFEGQTVVDWSIEAPGIEKAVVYRDAFGNVAHLVTQTGPHASLTVRAHGVVETEDRSGIVRGLGEDMPRDVFLRQTPVTAPNAAIRAIAAKVEKLAGLDLLHALMAEIRGRVDYETGATGAGTTAAEAVAAGKGVCQDHAHVFISAARHLGVPARFVTGYLAVEGEGPAEAGHAWAEALVDKLGWVGFDVANSICPTDRYVRIACGLDGKGVTPVRGTRRGGEGERLGVAVHIGEAVQQ